MGYYMQITESNFTIKKGNFDEVIKVVKNLVKKRGLLKWVNVEEVLNAKDIFEVISKCGWTVGVTTGNGDIDYIDFDGEKLGDDLILFEAIAPFVEKDSYIQMTGEDNCMWRWVFDGNACTESYADIVWR